MRRVRFQRDDVAALALFTVATLLMTWPLVLQLDTHLAGQDNDVWINPWATWWTGRALSEGQSLYYTKLMFYPRGVSLAFHSFSHLNAALELLLRPAWGGLAAYNVTILLAHVLSGYGMFCLVRYLTRDTRAALFGGLVFAFFPYRMNESVHPVLVSTQWMPLYFLFFLRLLKENCKRFAFPAAIFFILTALSSWHLMLLAGLLSAGYLVYAAVFERRFFSRSTVGNLALLVGLVGFVLLPFLYPLVREQLTVSRSFVGVNLLEGQGNDLLAFWLPTKAHPVWGERVRPLHQHIRSTHRPVYLGVTVVGLTVLAGLADRRRARFWLLLALASLLLSLGPRLQINGHDLGVPVPGSAALVWLLRHPFRFSLLLGFALAVTGGLGLSAALRRLSPRRGRWRWPLAGAVMTLLLFEYLYLPFPVTEAATPDFYADLSRQTGERAILELPMGRQPAKRYLYYQTVHGKPLIEGVVSRTPKEAYEIIAAVPILRSLRACGERALPLVEPALLFDPLAERGVAYVIFHKDWPLPASLNAWLDLRTLAPEYEDEQIAVYPTDAVAPREPGRPQLLEACVAVRPVDDGPISVSQGEIVEIPLEWTAGSQPRQEYLLELALADRAGETVRRQRYKVTPDVPLTSWWMGARHRATYPFLIDPLLPAGSYRVQAKLVPVEWEGEALFAVPLMEVQVSQAAEARDVLAAGQRVERTFGAVLSLEEYDLVLAPGALHVTLRWQALQPLETAYKFFLHLYEMESDVIVAQSDTMPYNWTYPTVRWVAGAQVPDHIQLPLRAVPSGTYRLAVGVYDPATGQRLPVQDAAGAGSMRDRLILRGELQLDTQSPLPSERQ